MGDLDADGVPLDDDEYREAQRQLAERDRLMGKPRQLNIARLGRLPDNYATIAHVDGFGELHTGENWGYYDRSTWVNWQEIQIR